jgi:hypothetical protein
MLAELLPLQVEHPDGLLLLIQLLLDVEYMPLQLAVLELQLLGVGDQLLKIHLY